MQRMPPPPNMLPPRLRARSALLLCSLAMAACSASLPITPQITAAQCPALPTPPVPLMTAPPPSGTYSNSVSALQATVQTTLKP